MRKTKKKKPDRRGKWSRDKWIRILELFADMSQEERRRCYRATGQFFMLVEDIREVHIQDVRFHAMGASNEKG